MTFPHIHRVVTGHDDSGRAIVLTEAALPTVVEVAAVPGTLFHEIWSTAATPARVTASEPDPTTGPLVLPPPPGGTRIRIVDIPPETAETLAANAARMGEAFSQIGDASASTGSAGAPHPLMHRTESVDYGVVLEGELTLVLDASEVQLRPGSVVIQRGTNHAWANRSGQPCRMLFVLVDGQFDAALERALPAR